MIACVVIISLKYSICLQNTVNLKHKLSENGHTQVNLLPSVIVSVCDTRLKTTKDSTFSFSSTDTTSSIPLLLCFRYDR